MAPSASAAVVSAEYDSPVKFALLLQVPLALLSLLALDGGIAQKVCGVAMASYLAGACLIWLRRPQSPTRSDLYFLKWGFLPILALATEIALTKLA